ncbi:MAG: hypothetical protein QM777_08720 [Pseudorhodoferax sp.]
MSTNDKVSAKPADRQTLTKADTVALWYAVNWMQHVLSGWFRDGFKDDQERAQYQAERERLATAKRALRKVNKLRKEDR